MKKNIILNIYKKKYFILIMDRNLTIAIFTLTGISMLVLGYSIEDNFMMLMGVLIISFELLLGNKI